MNYIKASQAAEKWGISPRRVRMLCAEGKIEGSKNTKYVFCEHDGIYINVDLRIKSTSNCQNKIYS